MSQSSDSLTTETPCPNREDKQHCEHWYDGGACCACNDEAICQCSLVPQHLVSAHKIHPCLPSKPSQLSGEPAATASLTWEQKVTNALTAEAKLSSALELLRDARDFLDKFDGPKSRKFLARLDASGLLKTWMKMLDAAKVARRYDRVVIVCEKK